MYIKQHLLRFISAVQRETAFMKPEDGKWGKFLLELITLIVILVEIIIAFKLLEEW